MEKELIPQPKLSKEEVIAEYVKTGLAPKYADVFWHLYSDEYDGLEGEPDDSAWALETAKYGIVWYILYKEIGHPEDWCQAAAGFGKENQYEELSLENIADCLSEVYRKFWQQDEASAVIELRRQCDHIGERFGKSPLYMRLFYEWYEDMSGGSDLLDHFSEMEFAYNDAISKGKSDDFAYFYATYPWSEPWRIAELRESLQKEGKDEDYIQLYLIKYADGLEDNGEEREHPDMPASWEEEVTAYMQGWDYARKEESGIGAKDQQRFIDVYVRTYMSARHPLNPSVIPWDRFDDFVLDIAVREFHGEHVEIEPWDPEAFNECMKTGRDPVEHKSREQLLREDILDMMYPNGQDDDD